ncbi:unnamed protein product, partial [Owenia fusiformis]
FYKISSMGFSRYVEIGRVAYIAYGPDKGKLVAIVDVIDQNRALVDGPCSGVGRKQMNFKMLHLTKLKIDISYGARVGTVTKAWNKAEITKKWEESTWAKKIANREKRAAMTDFDRFKLMKAKQTRNRLVNIEFGKLRAKAKKDPKKPRVNKKPSKK